MARRGSLQGRYGLAVAIVLLGLCPNIILTTAFVPLTKVLGQDLGASQVQLQLAEGMSNAGYAAGAVIAAQLAQRFVQRRLFLGYEAVFVLGSVLAAAAPGIGLFFAGRVLQGGATGFMLVSALPPLVTRFGVEKLPRTVAIVNIGLFGATTAGPLVGGLVAQAGAWRLLLVAVAAVGAAGWCVSALGYPHFDPPDPDLPVDRPAIALTIGATCLPFLATSILRGSSLRSPVFLVPFALGLLALVALVVLEYRKRQALMPVKALSSQLPVTGTIVAMIAGATFVTVIELVQIDLAMVAHKGPLAAGLLFWPLPLGLLVAAVLFGALFRTQFVPLLVNAGLLALAGGCALLLLVDPGNPGRLVLVASLALGFGAGATVSPGLFLAALGVPSERLGRAFALVELLRSEAAYAVTPIVIYVAEQHARLADGIRLGVASMVVLALVGLVASLAIPALSGARLRKPDLEGWLNNGRQAVQSPVTAVHLRPAVEDEAAEPLLPRGRREREIEDERR